MNITFRIIDASLNRAAEGLRLLEDIARFVLDDTAISGQLKTLRHDLVTADLAFNLQLLKERDSAGDVGIHSDVIGEGMRKELPNIVVANSRRVQESLRTLEELAKLPEMVTKLDSEKYKQARFAVYSLEQNIVNKLLRLDKIKSICGLYMIVDTACLSCRSHVEATKQVIKAGVKVIQLRDKTTPKKILLGIARELRDLCREYNVICIVNDYLDIALACEADGVHIGQDDLPVEHARKLLPIGMLLGCSVSTVEQAIAAQSAGADYLGVCAIYPTASKESVDVIGTERLQQIRQAVKIPLVAVGGINKNNVRDVINAGADSVAVISAVLQSPDIGKAAREIIHRIEAKSEKIDR